jgi:hypothetical protein
LSPWTNLGILAEDRGHNATVLLPAEESIAGSCAELRRRVWGRGAYKFEIIL